MAFKEVELYCEPLRLLPHDKKGTPFECAFFI